MSLLATSPGALAARACFVGLAGGLERIGLALALLVLLVFDLLDHLVERLDHAFLDFADLGSGPAQVEPPPDVFHPPRDLVERFLFQGTQIGLHQVGDGDVAPRAGSLGAVEQLIDDLEPFFLVEQCDDR